MDEHLAAQVVHQFSAAADSLVDACRQLEEMGIPDEPVELLLMSLDVVTQEVHRLYPPDEEVKMEPADLAAPPPCRVAARTAADPGAPPAAP